MQDGSVHATFTLPPPLPPLRDCSRALGPTSPSLDQQEQGRVQGGSDSATHTLPPLLLRGLLRGPLAKMGPPEAPPGCARAQQVRRSCVPVDAHGDSAAADLRIVHGFHCCLRILLGRVAHCAETPAYCVHAFRVWGMT